MLRDELDALVTIDLDAASTIFDTINALALRAFVEGAQPHACSRDLQRVRIGHQFLPPDITEIHTVREGRHVATIGCATDYSIFVQQWPNRTVEVLVTAADPAVAERVLNAAIRDAIEPIEQVEEQATIGFWFRGRCPTRHERTLDVTPWPTIRRNYADAVATAFDELMKLDAARVRGRLLLLHGPPGTGKTTALRALTSAWREWCQVDYVLDPDRLFNESDYLMTVALDAENDETPWRLLILEDCDELIRAHAKRDAGQALARLLNIADGLPGQGQNLLIAITTNESLAELHPAIIRPGRCLAQIEVGPLNVAEARAWLGRTPRAGAHGFTLAELFAQQGGLSVVEAVPDDPAVGQYL